MTLNKQLPGSLLTLNIDFYVCYKPPRTASGTCNNLSIRSQHFHYLIITCFNTSCTSKIFEKKKRHRRKEERNYLKKDPSSCNSTAVRAKYSANKGSASQTTQKHNLHGKPLQLMQKCQDLLLSEQAKSSPHRPHFQKE